jgi:hypothetical protein
VFSHIGRVVGSIASWLFKSQENASTHTRQLESNKNRFNHAKQKFSYQFFSFSAFFIYCRNQKIILRKVCRFRFVFLLSCLVLLLSFFNLSGTGLAVFFILNRERQTNKPKNFRIW